MFRFAVTLFVCACCVLGEDPHQLCDHVSQLDCSNDYVPYETDERVCGTDGVTYKNFCEYSQARCKTPTTHIAHIGDCSAPPPTTTVAVTAPVVTASTAPPSAGGGSTAPPATTTTTPGTTTVDATLQVFCQAKDAINCPQKLDPLCGSDKSFYLNQCEFTKARCDNSALSKQPITFCSPSSTPNP